MKYMASSSSRKCKLLLEGTELTAAWRSGRKGQRRIGHKVQHVRRTPSGVGGGGRVSMGRVGDLANPSEKNASQ